MNEISLKQNDVTITVSDKDGIQTVSARELHEKLGSNERFSKWWERFSSYGFIEHEDFTSVPKSTVVNNGALKEIGDYAITIEMAKQICMLQRSEKGKLYREYFLKLEKAWNSPEAVMARALQVANKTLEQAKRQIDIQQAQIEEMKPSATSWETYAGTMEKQESEKSFREVAKLLQINPQHSLINWLFKNGYILREKNRWTASQQGLVSGILVNRIVNAQNGFVGEQCKVTAYGMKKLADWKEKGVFDHCLVKEKVYGEKKRSDYRHGKGGEQ